MRQFWEKVIVYSLIIVAVTPINLTFADREAQVTHITNRQDGGNQYGLTAEELKGPLTVAEQAQYEGVECGEEVDIYCGQICISGTYPYLFCSIEIFNQCVEDVEEALNCN